MAEGESPKKTWRNALAGAMGGLAIPLATHPVDLVKTRMQGANSVLGIQSSCQWGGRGAHPEIIIILGNPAYIWLAGAGMHTVRVHDACMRI